MDKLKRKLEEQLELANRYQFPYVYLTIPLHEAVTLERLIEQDKDYVPTMR